MVQIKRFPASAFILATVAIAPIAALPTGLHRSESSAESVYEYTMLNDHT